MNKKAILEILNDWNFWQNDLKTGFRRDLYLAKLKSFLAANQVIDIIGPRRSGKSFLIRQMAKDLIARGVESHDILIINFEDQRWTKLDLELLQTIYAVYLELIKTSDSSKPAYVFLDEIQEIKNWERWVRTMHELQKAKLVISGSNAELLGGELATVLTGRHLTQMVLPLSFAEVLMFKQIKINDQLSLINNGIEIKKILNNVLEFGLFPEVVLQSGQQKLLPVQKDTVLNYFNDIINKDVIKRYKIRKEDEIRSLAKFYLSNISSLITFNSIAKHLAISVETIKKFSAYLETAYLVFFLKRFSYKVKEQEKSPRKVYAVDLGLANTVGFRFSQNLGKLMENFVFLELLRKSIMNSDYEIYYWQDRQHREVDFVIKKGLQVEQLIQVCSDLRDIRVKKREINALLKAMDEFGLGQGLVITEEQDGEEVIKGKKIVFKSLLKWVLGI